MNAIGFASVVLSLIAGIGAGGCMVYAIYRAVRGGPHLGLRLFQTFFAFAGFVTTGMLAGIVAVTIGHVPYHSP